MSRLQGPTEGPRLLRAWLACELGGPGARTGTDRAVTRAFISGPAKPFVPLPLEA